MLFRSYELHSFCNHCCPTTAPRPPTLCVCSSECCVCVCVQWLQSCSTFCDPMDCSPQVPLSMGFSRHAYWSGSPCPPPGDLPDPRGEPESPTSPALQVDSLPLAPSGKPLKEWFSSVHSTQLCLILRDPMDHSTPGLPVHHQLPESTQTHLH